jgi:acyl-CoA reductase-like NAD-dependent aldehyde dehydrogenase
VARADATERGVAASIWTDNLSTAHRLAAHIDAGASVTMLPLLDAAAVHGGFGLELSRRAFDELTRTRVTGSVCSACW